MRGFLAAAGLGLAGLVAGSTAQAAVVLQATNMGSPATGLTQYKISIVSDNGNISAIDFGGTKKPSGGFFGPLHQAWNKFATPNETPAVSPANQGTQPNPVDSHLVLNYDVVGSAAVEDNSKTGSPLPADYGSPFPGNAFYDFGTGTKLQGAVGWEGANQTLSKDVAYIVLKTGDTATYAIQVATAGGTFDIDGNIGGAPVPEPASLGLLALGAVGLVARRRRA